MHVERSPTQRQTTWRLLCLFWTEAIVWATTSPWSDFLGHPHWDKIRLVPFADFSQSYWDLAENFLLFVPLGFCIARSMPRAARVPGTSTESRGQSVGPALRVALRQRMTTILLVAVLSTALSMSVEFFQVFTHTRIPSATDVCANLLGSLLGVAIDVACRLRPCENV